VLKPPVDLSWDAVSLFPSSIPGASSRPSLLLLIFISLSNSDLEFFAESSEDASKLP
jgi:hypothetical protein